MPDCMASWIAAGLLGSMPRASSSMRELSTRMPRAYCSIAPSSRSFSHGTCV